MDSHDLMHHDADHERDTPLPLLVAEQWGFPLQSYIVEGVYWFAVQDWIIGLATSEPKNAAKMWSKMKEQLSTSNRQLPYTASSGRKYAMDFAQDRDLYLIAQHMRAVKTRPALAAIKQYLANAGAFTDLVRRKPEAVVAELDPDDAADAVIEAYQKQGKSDAWISARLVGKVKRNEFTRALKAAIRDMRPWQYGAATNEIYEGLWGRTAEYLKKELDIPEKASLRDNQPTLALTYQAIAEEVSAHQLGEQTRISWNKAKAVVREVSDLIGQQASATSKYLGVDLATGKPLLESGEDD